MLCTDNIIDDYDAQYHAEAPKDKPVKGKKAKGGPITSRKKKKKKGMKPRKVT